MVEHAGRRMLSGILLALGFMVAAAPAADAQTRSLKLYFLHTKERAEITYMRNGRYLQSGLREINHFLRDWRRDEATKMDPQLLDLLWEVYRATGSNDYIHVISAYRSPETNTMLRKRSSGVAKKSQHTLGKAIDFYLPDVKLSKLRAVGLKLQAGGVGYYPRSGSPFVHLDVGGVRHWPRMSRKELVALFPEGKTMHVPSDGDPLPGYEQALASYKQRKSSGDLVQVASSSGGSGRGLLAALFGGGGGGADQEEDEAETTVASAPEPRRTVRQSEPEPEEPAETPATILASLPQRAVPVPSAAPRPDLESGQSLPFEVKPVEEPATSEETAPESEETPAATQVAANVPTPTQRPDRAPAAPEEERVQLAAAEGEAPDAIAEVLANEASREREGQRPVATAAYLPVPSQRPSRSETDRPAAANAAERGAQVDLASLSSDYPRETGETPTPAALATVDPEQSQPVSASLRQVLLSNEEEAPARRIESRTRSTGKSARPGPDDVTPGARPVVVATTGQPPSHALNRNSLLNEAARPAGPPAFDSEMVRSPETVYTTGFRNGDDAATEATRFTGKAVNFITMARFQQ